MTDQTPDAAQGKPKGGYYRCTGCGWSETVEREVKCWKCGQGLMAWIMPPISHTITGESGLRECPFCNHHNISVHENDWATPSEYYCYCRFCHARTESHANRDHAIAAWNTRSTPRATEGDAIHEALANWDMQRNGKTDPTVIAAGDWIAQLLQEAIAGRRAGTEGDVWEPLSTWTERDDLIWLLKHDSRGNTIEGPRVGQIDDIDYWDFWCYAEAPPFTLHSTATQADGGAK